MSVVERRRENPNGLVRLRVNGRGIDAYGDPVYTLTVPAHIARHISSLAGALFVCDLTDEGIIFRPVRSREFSRPIRELL